MGAGKELFLQDKALSEKWRAWAKSADFNKVLVCADAELLNSSELTPDHLRGAKAFKEILLTLAEPEDDTGGFPQSGLHHDLDPKPRTKESLAAKKQE